MLQFQCSLKKLPFTHSILTNWKMNKLKMLFGPEIETFKINENSLNKTQIHVHFSLGV